MATQRHLNNAPITEAVIDLRVQNARAFDAALMEELAKRTDRGYVPKGPVRLNEFGIEGDKGVHVAVRDIGYRYHSADDKFVVQFQAEGFTVSRLAPYLNWANLKAEAEAFWPVYRDIMTTQRITRTACRYINNLRLPMQPKEDFNIYLTTSPQVPAELPQSLLGFMQRVVIPNSDANAVTILSQYLEKPAATPAEPVPVILDIDVAVGSPYDPGTPDVWKCLDTLHDLKNDAFFASITEAAARLYE